MVQAVEGPLGRQFTTGAAVPGVTTAGKSGTAELGGTGEPHSWFIGFAPAENPKIAIAVLVEQAGRGGEVAAPIAGDLMAALPERAQVTEPSVPTAPDGPATTAPDAARAPAAHRADRAGGRRPGAGDPVRGRGGGVVGRRRAVPGGDGRDRLPDDVWVGAVTLVRG